MLHYHSSISGESLSCALVGPASQAELDVKHAIAGDELRAMSGTMAIRNDALPWLRGEQARR